MPDQKAKRRLTVVSMEEEFSGTGKNGPYTIYAVQALDEAGQPVDARLRTFDKDLPLNELVEYDVSRRDNERHGTTYTLEIPGKRGGGLKESVDELRQRLEALEARVANLEAGGGAGNPGFQSAATPPGGASF